MNTKHPDVPWPDPHFSENQSKIPPEIVASYAGQHVAWSWDGSGILAGAADRDTLEDKLEAAGIPADRVVFGYVPEPDVSYL